MMPLGIYCNLAIHLESSHIKAGKILLGQRTFRLKEKKS